ncbi:hypothetical protein AKJ52_02855 [candidate division MSBL1 archaeon SCGC-AAA382C18]|uniref:Transposase IS4-like domain-containing protein n=1 Tax=candidate division MSBL1 archaeon SCGC-AAA382C18 TaxID=1698281 RepID=A0A133VHJ7_9EURY|nr:hypothetical protein AKJ52_02855 [candidate division MSBL1 archaeon SCGC-AAA382C18]
MDFGYSRDHRSDKEQIVLGVIMCERIPIAHKLWSGNTVDKSTLKETVERLKERFEMGKMVFVADRGVMTIPNLKELEDVGYEYVLSTDRRKGDLAEELLKKDVPGEESQRAREVHQEEADDATRRYILCLDEKTRKERLETLDETRGGKKKELQDLKDRFEESQKGRGRPMTEKGVKKRANKIVRGHKRLFDIWFDETLKWKLKKEKWEYERTIAGKFLLVTTSDLKPSNAMEAYKDLKDVERAFDELKNFLKIRPIYHHTDKRLEGHVFVCILALLLERLIERKTDQPFTKIFRKLKMLKASVIKFRGEKFIQRTKLEKSQRQIFESIGTIEPPKILDVVTKK